MVSTVAQIPLFERLETAERVLVAGCGGGFDIYCGVPLALALWRQGKQVVLSNLTFAAPRGAKNIELVDDVVTRIDASTVDRFPYFPELHLARWLAQRQLPDAVYCVERTGVVPMTAAYQSLVERERIDAIIVVDGGTDSLMRGDESSLGTPFEDAATLVSMEDVDRPRNLVCVGFGVDAFHGVCHAHFLENVAALARRGGFLGTFSLLPGQEEGEAYLDLVRFASEHQPHHASIVNTSIAAAVEGRFGDHHATARTQGSELFINPLMAVSWCFDLPAVVDRLLYSDIIKQTHQWSEVMVSVRAAMRIFQGKRTWAPIPC